MLFGGLCVFVGCGVLLGLRVLVGCGVLLGFRVLLGCGELSGRWVFVGCGTLFAPPPVVGSTRFPGSGVGSVVTGQMGVAVPGLGVPTVPSGVIVPATGGGAFPSALESAAFSACCASRDAARARTSAG